MTKATGNQIMLGLEIKNLLNRVGYDEHCKEWEYDDVYVTRDDVTNRLLNDINSLLVETEKRMTKTKEMLRDGVEHQTFSMRADRATDIVDSIEMGQAIERLSRRVTELEKQII